MDADTAADTLSRLRGAGELRAAVLALLLPDSQRAGRAFEIETQGLAHAATLREAATALPRESRLPWIERLVGEMGAHPPPARQELLESARRLMTARGGISPIDRLHWLMLRQRLGSRVVFGSGAGDGGLDGFIDSAALAASAFCGHLARVVPTGEPEAGRAWYDTVITPWKVRHLLGPMPTPDGDALVHALGLLQGLSWTQRPVLVRSLVDAAWQHSPNHRLGDDAADALRLTCVLLDAPMPPRLQQHYALAKALPTA